MLIKRWSRKERGGKKLEPFKQMRGGDRQFDEEKVERLHLAATI